MRIREEGRRIMRMLSSLVAVCLVSLIAAPVQAAMSLEELALYKGPDRMKILEEGAKKEGQVVMYGTLSPENAVRPLTVAFQKKYPAVQLRNWTGTTGEIMPKILAERRANAQVADVLEWGDGSLPAVKAGAVIPYYVEALKDIPEQYYDAKGYWVADRVSYFGIGYNTRQITPNDVPNTWDDLLQPKYKNKMVWRAGSEPGAPPLHKQHPSRDGRGEGGRVSQETEHPERRELHERQRRRPRQRHRTGRVRHGSQHLRQ